MSENLKLWDALSKTDPAHTKKFTRAGGFKGTSIKPIYMIRKMTEQFGPAGKGWGMNSPQFEVVHTQNQIAVYCTVSLWWESLTQVVFGVGGDIVAGSNKNGPFTDDEAFKKAYTDALSNAMKQIGVGADVHMGQHDDDKYVAELKSEFSGEKPKDPVMAAISDSMTGKEVPKKDPLGPWKGPLVKSKLIVKLREMKADVLACDDFDQLRACLTTYQTVIEQLKVDAPEWWDGEPDGNGHSPMKWLIDERESFLSAKVVDYLRA